LKDFLGGGLIVPEIGVGDLLLYLVELPLLAGGVKENSAARGFSLSTVRTPVLFPQTFLFSSLRAMWTFAASRRKQR
jgi:hypothetical protein